MALHVAKNMPRVDLEDFNCMVATGGGEFGRFENTEGGYYVRVGGEKL